MAAAAGGGTGGSGGGTKINTARGWVGYRLDRLMAMSGLGEKTLDGTLVWELFQEGTIHYIQLASLLKSKSVVLWAYHSSLTVCSRISHSIWLIISHPIMCDPH